MKQIRQIKVQCNYKDSDRDDRDPTISFYVDVGPLRLVCISHIPPEGEATSFTYVRAMAKPTVIAKARAFISLFSLNGKEIANAS